MSDAEVAANTECACGHGAFHHRRADGVCLYQEPGGYKCGCQGFQFVPQTNQQSTGAIEYPPDSDDRLSEIEQRLNELESNHATERGDDRLDEVERRLDKLSRTTKGDDSEDRLAAIERRFDELKSRREADHASEGGVIGYSLGTCIAVVLSWSRNGSILWCILHGLFSWGYVIYFALTR